MSKIKEPIDNKVFKHIEPMILEWLKDQKVNHIDYGDSFVEWHDRGYSFKLELKVKHE